MSFRITGLPAERFAHLFALSDPELAAQGAVRRTADGRMPGYPCRVSLTDSHEGDELILVNYEHHGVDFALSHAIRDLCPRGRHDL